MKRNAMATFAEEPSGQQSARTSSPPGRHHFYNGFEKVESYFASSPFREQWDDQREYVLACIGYAVGFSNVWAFPYVVNENGRIAFLIPYVVIMMIIVYPVLYMETLLGQFSGCNAFGAFNFAPVCKGIGIGLTLIQLYVCIFYIVYLTYSTKYLFDSFAARLPWAECSETWGANSSCHLRPAHDRVSTNRDFNGTNCSYNQTAAHQYWIRAVLHAEDDAQVYGLDNIGPIEWDLFGFLILSWVIQYLFLIRGIKSAGKIVYFTATFPIGVLLLFFLYTMTMNGASEGVTYLFTPEWHKIAQVKAWFAAANQAGFSVGIGMGVYILYSSYNNFEFRLHWHAFFVIFVDFLTSFVMTMLVYGFLGNLAHNLNCDISRVVAKGAGLVFVVIPEVIATMPAPQVCCVLYFLMLVTLGIDSQSFIVDSLLTTIYEELRRPKRFRRHQTPVRMLGCLSLFVLGILCVTRGGFFVLEYLRIFSSQLSLLFLVLCETIAVMFVYGWRRFCDDIEFMTGRRVNVYWKVCWAFVLPIMLTVLLVLEAMTLDEICSHYSSKVCFIGWLITASCTLPVPITAIVYLWRYTFTTYTWRAAFLPTHNWGPRDVLNKISYLDYLNKKGEAMVPQVRDTLAELAKEVTVELPTVRQVAMQRATRGRMSIFQHFLGQFHEGEVGRLQAAQLEPVPEPEPVPVSVSVPNE